jgi:aminomethyltransferase
MVEFAGYEMPIQYEGIIAEHLWTRENAGLFDVSHMGQLFVHGPEVDTALEMLLPGDLKGLGDRKLRYSMLLDDSGGIIDDLMAARRGRGFLHRRQRSDQAWRHRGHAPDAAGSDFLDHMKAQALLALQGPKAVEVLEAVVPGVSELTFMEGNAFRAFGHDLWISRSGYTGEDGFEISIPASVAEQLAEKLVADERVKPVGLGARDSLRLEAGLPLYGHDLDPRHDPGDGGPHLRDPEAPPRRGRLSRALSGS